MRQVFILTVVSNCEAWFSDREFSSINVLFTSPDRFALESMCTEYSVCVHWEASIRWVQCVARSGQRQRLKRTIAAARRQSSADGLFAEDDESDNGLWWLKAYLGTSGACTRFAFLTPLKSAPPSRPYNSFSLHKSRERGQVQIAVALTVTHVCGKIRRLVAE